jgi:hypothetical protein
MGNVKKQTSLSKNIKPGQEKIYGQRVLTEEQENHLVNKIAEKIFSALRYSPNAGSIKPPVEQPVEPAKIIPIEENIININKNFVEFLSNIDIDEKNKNKKTIESSKKKVNKA